MKLSNIVMLMSVIVCVSCTNSLNGNILNPNATKDSLAELNLSQTVTTSYNISRPATISINTLTLSPVANSSELVFSYGGGSGVVIDPKGYILTCSHVIADADYVDVTLFNGKEYRASVVNNDSIHDLALLKIDPKETLYSVALGSQEDLIIGDQMIAIGDPFGYSGTLTKGIISSLNKNWTVDSGKDKNKTLTGILGTDLTLNPGNSGGPLLNTSGKLIGINVGGGSGLGFAVPINQINDFISSALKDFNPPKPDIAKLISVTNEIGKVKLEGVDASYNLALSQYNTGHYDKAVEEFKKVIAIDPNNIKANLKLASLMFDDFNYKEAADYLNKVLTTDPSDNLAQTMMGLVYYNTVQIDKAKEQFQRAITSSDTNIIARIGLASCYMADKNPDDAIKTLEEILKIKPDHSVTYVALGNIYAEKKDYTNALAKFTKALEINQSLEYVNVYIALTYLGMKEDTKAFELLDKTTGSSDPKAAAAAYVVIGMFETATKDFYGAIDIFEKAKKLQPDNHYIHYQLGMLYSLKGDVTSAISEYKEAIRLNPLKITYYNDLGDIYVQAGDYEAAEYNFNIVLKALPDYVTTQLKLAILYTEMKRYDEAIAKIQAVILKSNDKGANAMDAHYLMGRLYMAQSAYASAVAEFNKALALDPVEVLVNPSIHYHLGKAYENLKNKDEAKKEYETYLKIQPDGLYSTAAKEGVTRVK